jgi:hypothetical protein
MISLYSITRLECVMRSVLYEVGTECYMSFRVQNIGNDLGKADICLVTTLQFQHDFRSRYASTYKDMLCAVYL